uniref:NACHT LRR and PYD domain-containing protein n=1 Tax=Oryzias latipes TaxID=8090 RepID=A0A3P9KPB1_ORYLA
MFHCYSNRKVEVIEDFLKNNLKNPCLDEFLSRVIEKSLQSQTGHLDLLVRFLHGLSVESNQRLLGRLLGQTEKNPRTIQRLLGGLLGQSKNNPGTIQRAINNLKKINSEGVSPDRSINIYHCLMEMKDLSVHQEIQEFLKSENNIKKELSEIHCSALAYILQTSDEVLDKLDLNQYKTSAEGIRRLIPAVRNCRKILERCGLSETLCKIMASALKSNPSHLTELDLTNNILEDSSMEVLCSGLESPNCRLQTLSCCEPAISEAGDLDVLILDLSLSWNLTEVPGPPAAITAPEHTFLSDFRLKDCRLSEIGCEALGSALKKSLSNLAELDLSENNLPDSGVLHLCGFLESPDCRLKTLRLIRCSLSEISCESLGLALKKNPSNLTELDLSYNNNLQDSGVLHLCGFLESPDCRLQTLRLKDCSLSEISCEALVSALKKNPSNLTELDLSWNVQQLQDLVESPNFKLQTLRSVEGWSQSSCFQMFGPKISLRTKLQSFL